jgi:adhesin/invasin
VNAASFAAPAAPGAIFSIFGTNLAPASVAAETVPWPRSLAGVSVEVNGIPIPLNAVTPGQINAQLPYETAPGTASVVVITADGRSAPVTFEVAAAAPGIFTYGGTVRAIAANQDFSLNAPENPEARGRALVFYVTGLGVVKPAAATGGPASADPLSNAVATIAATVGGVSAEVRFAGLTPGFVGLGQVNVIVPDGAPTGDAVPVTIQGSKAATVSIRP